MYKLHLQKSLSPARIIRYTHLNQTRSLLPLFAEPIAEVLYIVRSGFYQWHQWHANAAQGSTICMSMVPLATNVSTNTLSCESFIDRYLYQWYHWCHLLYPWYIGVICCRYSSEFYDRQLYQWHQWQNHQRYHWRNPERSHFLEKCWIIPAFLLVNWKLHTFASWFPTWIMSHGELMSTWFVFQTVY